MRLLLLGSVSLALAASCASQSAPEALFSEPRRIEMGGRQPGDVALGDVNDDGHLDIVSANSGSRDVSILLGDGRGGFAPAPGSPFGVGTAAGQPTDSTAASAADSLSAEPRAGERAAFAPHLVVLADLDEDGRLDLALTSHDHNEAALLRGDGAGGFAAMPGSQVRFLEAARAHNHGLAAADVSGDGHLDLVTSNQDDNSVSILLGDGMGRFAPAAGSPVAVGRAPYPFALGDLNGDGALDIVTPDVQGGTVTVLLGDGRGGFRAAPGSPHAVDPRPYFIAIARVDGDSALDVIASHDDTDRLALLTGDGAGGLAPPRRIDAGGRPWKARIADVDNDGDADLLTGTAAGLAVLLGDGAGAFRRAPGSPFPVGKGPWGLAVGDVNHDGRLDAVTANLEDNDLTLLLGR